jgi:hypothetical protein
MTYSYADRASMLPCIWPVEPRAAKYKNSLIEQIFQEPSGGNI